MMKDIICIYWKLSSRTQSRCDYSIKKIYLEGNSKKNPAAQLHIYGAYPTQQVLEFTNANEGFLYMVL